MNADSKPASEPSRGWPRRRFRWLRIGVRTLLVLVLLAGLGLGWTADKIRRANRQHTAAQAVVALKGSVEYGNKFRLEAWGFKQMLGPPPRHAWLRAWLGDDLFDTATRVTFYYQEAVTDADMALLDAFPDLEEFYVNRARVTDAGLVHLAGLKKLRNVTLREVPITDAGLLSIARLPELTAVDLNGTRIGDAGLAVLGTMPQLRGLSLEWTRVTDAGLASLSGLGRLEWLDLDCTEVGDGGLVYIAPLKSLKHLKVGGTLVSESGRDEIQAALPDCKLTWWARHVEPGVTPGGSPKIPEPISR